MDSALSLDSQIQKLEDKIKAANLAPDLMEKINSMLTILKVSLKTGTGTFVNYESISNYLDWVTSLPFHKETPDVMDLVKVKTTLDKNHYGLDSVKNTILEYLSSLILEMQSSSSSQVRAPALCLVGLVGTGKTTLAYSIAEALGRSFERIPFGGMGDALTLRGQSRAMSDAEPGQIIPDIWSSMFTFKGLRGLFPRRFQRGKAHYFNVISVGICSRMKITDKIIFVFVFNKVSEDIFNYARVNQRTV